ncbi:MAG: anti-sigma factor RsbA family regulatory protein [Solirubrobacteraceae bacterium]
MTGLADIHCGGLHHPALFYGDDDDYLDGVASFVRDGLDAGEPVLVAVPGRRVELVRSELDGSSEQIELVDMAMLGRNPSRIIPTVRAFTDSHPGRRTRFVGEPIWPGRSPAEIREATRHEALLNLAFAQTATTILCPYDTAGLDEQVLDDARRTHPHVIRSSRQQASSDYAGSALATATLPPRPDDAEQITFDVDGLAGLRRFVAERAAGYQLPPQRAQELVLAVHELAANTVRHSRHPTGTLAIWRASDTGAMICEITDRGCIDDPLAGRSLPPAHAAGGRGLWLVNQICDLVELHSGADGTTIRLHATPPPGSPG